MEPESVICGRYLLLERIGAGGSGVVFKATDQRLRQTVALKRVSFAELDGESAQLTRDRALREARLAAQLRDHPHVVTVYDVLTEGNDIWLVMNYLPARSLGELLRTHTRLSPADTARIGAQLADALAAAHACGIEHRDIKPGNVLIGTDGTVKLTDFGISHLTGDPHLTHTGISGTPAYLAPEVAARGESSPASDVFSLGSTLYATVEGHPPFGTDENALRLLNVVRTGIIRPPTHAGALEPLLLRLLHINPSTRPDAGTIRDLLTPLTGGTQPTKPAARRWWSRWAQRPQWPPRGPTTVAGAAQLPRSTGNSRELTWQDRQDGMSRPAQLPADVNVFTGRGAELAKLDQLVDGTADPTTTAMVISVVSGTAGVGKTALALRWAHRVRGEFLDGQLYVNLRGYDPDQPMAAAAALAGFLRALGTAGQDIPLEVDERAAAYRSLLDGRRILVVLDNAADAEQVRPLLPGTRSCVVVVTSRDRLAGLVIRHGAQRIDLDLLPLDDAVALLRALIGERVDAELDAATALAGYCARLPLALQVAAERAAARPATRLTALVIELGDERRRLDLLDASGDPRTAVRAVFSWSYRHLPANEARAFRLLGLHPGPDLEPYAAAALTAIDHDKATQLLDLLARVHLIEPTSDSRYGMHDLLRAYAVDLAVDEDTEEDRRAALTRLFDYYLATAATAMDILVPAEKHRRPLIPPPATPAPPVADPPAARTWLDTERVILVAVAAHTAAHNWPSHTTRLATVLFRYLDTGGHYPDAVVVHTHAVHAARRLGDPAVETHALTNLGTVYWQQGRHEHAADNLQQALILSREIGDRISEARALGNLGLVSWKQSRYEQAADHLQQALTLFQEIDDRAGQARTLSSLGLLYWRQGHYEQAADRLQQALLLSREIGDRAGEANALDDLGVVDQRQGRYDAAADHHRQALLLSREIGNRAGEADALDNLGVVDQRQGRYDDAADHHRQALALFRELGYREGETEALTNLGSFYQRQGYHDLALDHHQQALALSRELGYRAGEVKILNGVGELSRAIEQLDEAHSQHNAALTLATEIGDRYEQARAHNGLAHIHHAIGESDQARPQWCRALDLYTDLGVPEADDVRAQLATLDRPANGD